MDARTQIRRMIEDYVAENLEDAIDSIDAEELVSPDMIHDSVLEWINDHMDVDKIVSDAVDELM